MKNNHNKNLKICSLAFILGIVFIILPCLNPVVLYGLDNHLELSSPVVDGMSFFNQDMYTLLKYFGSDNNKSDASPFDLVLDLQLPELRKKFFTHYFSFTGDITTFGDSTENGDDNGHIKFDYLNAINFRIWRMRLSLFLSITMGKTAFSYDGRESYIKSININAEQVYTFLGGGLAYESDILYIGAYVGAFGGTKKIEKQEMIKWDSPLWTVPEWKILEDEENYSINYTIIPIYYPQKLSFIKNISALISLNVYNPNEVYTSIVSRKFTLLKRETDFTLYFKHEVYDLLAKNNFYGLSMLTQIIPYKDTMQMMIDTGYQQFINIKYDFDEFYNNAPYLKLGLRFNFKYAYLWTHIMLDRNNFPSPQLDISIGLNLPRVVVASGKYYFPTENSGNYQRGFAGKLLWGI